MRTRRISAVAIALAGTFLLALPGTSLAAGVMVGDGDAVVSQNLAGQPGKWLQEEVSVLGAFAENVGSGGHSTVFRFQFVRPDSKGVAYAVFTLPPGAFAGTFPVGLTGAGLIYYEVHPDNPGQKLFVADHASGEIAISSALPTEVRFTLTVTRDAGKKDEPADDEVRLIEDARVWFFGPGDLSKVNYYYDPYYDQIYYSNDVYIVYDDGCTGGPDTYDDGSYDDTDYYGDSGGDYSGDSCDGDVYDDGGSSGSSDWGDSSSDASCDYDDSSSDDSSSSGTSSGGDSGWEGNDWAESTSDDDDDDDDGVVEGDTWRIQGMSWFAPIGKLVKSHRRAMRLMPLFLALGVIGMLRRFGRRATSACGR